MPPLSPVELEHERQQDALLMAQLKKMYGGTDWGDWTDAQIDIALEEMEREASASEKPTTAF
jgi:hypothetical protein